MKIVIVVFDQFTDIDVFLPWDLLNRVRLVGGVSDWEVKIVGQAEFHTSMAGLTIPTSGDLSEISDADAVIVSSGSGVQSLIRDEVYLNRLPFLPEKQLIGSMCSGALLLGAKGLLRGKKATTYPSAVNQLEEYGVEVVEESFVVQGNIATAAGCLAAEELVTWVIRSLLDQKMADRVIESVQPVGRGLSFQK